MDTLAANFWILVPAFFAGVLVLLSHVPLGREVLDRGIIFLDLAIAQVAAFGLLLSRWLPHGTASHDAGGSHSMLDGHLLSSLIAYGAAIMGASGFYLARNAPARVQEALIGIVFVLAASGGILVLANHPQGGEHLKEILVGQILWVEPAELVIAALVSAAVAAAWFVLQVRRAGFMFYPLFAIAVTLSTQMVGVFLVFASLIIPALAAHGRVAPLRIAYAVGVAGYASGLALSAILDQPSGALIVWTLAACGLLARAIRPGS